MPSCVLIHAIHSFNKSVWWRPQIHMTGQGFRLQSSPGENVMPAQISSFTHSLSHFSLHPLSIQPWEACPHYHPLPWIQYLPLFSSAIWSPNSFVFICLPVPSKTLLMNIYFPKTFATWHVFSFLHLYELYYSLKYSESLPLGALWVSLLNKTLSWYESTDLPFSTSLNQINFSNSSS